MSAYATIYAMSKDFNLDMVILKSQFDQLHPFFPNVSEDLVVEKRFCDHCAFKWILKKPAWFRFARQRKALVRKGLAITLTAYPNAPDFYKVTISITCVLYRATVVVEWSAKLALD